MFHAFWQPLDVQQEVHYVQALANRSWVPQAQLTDHQWPRFTLLINYTVSLLGGSLFTVSL